MRHIDNLRTRNILHAHERAPACSIIYTGYYFWQDNVGGPTDNLNCPLWLAAYDSNPLIPAAWVRAG